MASYKNQVRQWRGRTYGCRGFRGGRGGFEETIWLLFRLRRQHLGNGKPAKHIEAILLHVKRKAPRKTFETAEYNKNGTSRFHSRLLRMEEKRSRLRGCICHRIPTRHSDCDFFFIRFAEGLLRSCGLLVAAPTITQSSRRWAGRRFGMGRDKAVRLIANDLEYVDRGEEGRRRGENEAGRQGGFWSWNRKSCWRKLHSGVKASGPVYSKQSQKLVGAVTRRKGAATVLGLAGGGLGLAERLGFSGGGGREKKGLCRRWAGGPRNTPPRTLCGRCARKEPERSAGCWPPGICSNISGRRKGGKKNGNN